MSYPQSFIPEPWSKSNQPASEWLYATGCIEQALAYAQLFWPPFIEHDGCIFLALDLDNYAAWTAKLPAKSEVEAMINHRHILDLFHETGSRKPHEWLILMGRTLKQCWTAKLKLQFPERQFEVVFDETIRADPVEYQITFYQS